MDTASRDRQDTIRALLADAPHEVLVKALLLVLDTTAGVQRSLDYDDFGIGDRYAHDVVTTAHAAASTVGDEVDGSVLAVLLRQV